MTFDDMWKSLEEKDTTGKYKQAREMAELGMEQLKYAYNSGYADAKSKYERSQGEWIFHKDYNKNCRYGCNQCGNLNNISSNFCPNCGAGMKFVMKKEKVGSDKLSDEEAKARYICCPMCDRKTCNRRAEDCDVVLYFKNERGDTE